MAKSKQSFESRVAGRQFDVSSSAHRPRSQAEFRHVHLAKFPAKDHFSLVEPQISADGIHKWPFDDSCPVDVQFMTGYGGQEVRMNRHRYFEVLYLCSGAAACRIQDRVLPFNEGDLVVIGSSLYHRVECRSSAPLTIAALFFEPDLIRCDGGSDGAEYLAPFLFQDAKFPHIVPGETGIPEQVLELMLQIRSELPVSSTRARLAMKTYLKMLLMLLVNQYAPYAGTLEMFERQQRALERLRPLFRYLGENCDDAIQVQKAARICAMSESHFMSFFKQVTGVSFMKYLNHCRVARAQSLLTETDEPLASIGQSVGFCGQSYFGFVFRKVVGTTPAIYRRRFRNENVTNPERIQDPHRMFEGRFSIPRPGPGSLFSD